MQFNKSHFEESFDRSFKKRTTDFSKKYPHQPNKTCYYPKKNQSEFFDWDPFSEMRSSRVEEQKVKTLLELEEEKRQQKSRRGNEEKKSKEVCKFFMRGYCKFGNSCKLTHPALAEQKRDLRRQQYYEEVKSFYSTNLPESFNELDSQIKRINSDLKKIDETFGYSNKFKLGRQPKSVDVMFIIDCTYSMTNWIEACKTQMKAIVEHIKKKFANIRIRLSVIAYRDFQDGANRMQIHNFNSDINAGITFLTGLRAIGGGDFPEDVAGGLFEGLMQQWESDAKYAIFIADAPPHGKQYHNQTYGDTQPDGDPNGRTIEDLITTYAKRGIFFNAIKITHHTEKVFSIMNECYKKVAKRDIPIQDLGNGPVNLQAFQNFVTTTISHSISNSTQMDSNSLGHKLLQLSSKGEHQIVDNAINQYKKYQKEQQQQSGSFNSQSLSKSTQNKAESKFGAIKEEDEIKEVEEEEDEEEKEAIKEEEEDKEEEVKGKDEDEILKELEELEKKKKEEEEKKEPKEAEQKVTFPIKSLEETKTYVGSFDAICHTYFIVNESGKAIDWRKPKIEQSQMTTKVKMATEPFADGAMRYAFYLRDVIDDQDQVAKIPKKISKRTYNLDHMKKEIETTITCSYIVNDFNDRITLLSEHTILTEFVNAFIYEFTDPSVEYKWAYGENFIDGIYQKYNNNAGWTSEQSSLQVKIAQTLSHFSWQLTQGYLLITDLQGVGNILTDPQIHCVDQDRFGSGNLGLYGILLYFDTHICNEFCKKLNLIHPRKIKQLPENFDMFGQLDFSKITNTSSHKVARKKVSKLCELCKKPQQLKYRELMNQRVKGKEFWCKPCYDKLMVSKIDKKCLECKATFSCSKYYYRMKKTDLPSSCEDCKKQLAK